MARTFSSFQDWQTFVQEALDDNPNHIVDITVIQINTRSVKKHWNQLCLHLSQANETPDVIVLCETNLRPSECCLYALDGYNQYNYSRKERKGGGVIVYVKSEHRSEIIEYSFDSAETVMVSVNTQTENYVISAIYRPPGNNIDDFLQELHVWLRKVHSENPLIIGDINIDTAKQANQNVLDYQDLLAGYGLKNMIEEFTREEWRGNNFTRTIIDHIIASTKRQSVPGVIRQKVAHHYFISLAYLKENVTSNERDVQL